MKQRFRNLVDQHRHRIYTFAYYHLGNREEAEDVTQEVLVKMWQHRETIEPGSLNAWLSRVTRNGCIDVIRKRNRYQAVVVPEEVIEAGVKITAVGAGQDAVLDNLGIRMELEKALNTLEEPYRSIVILREIQELKYDEISKALDLPMGTVKVYLHRARRMLRACLKETTG
jgi:RNA polymerase sigma factor (sigma-70 family)